MTQVHPMLEKVARAIGEEDAQVDKYWHVYLPQARAAVRALMEPTQDMIEAGAEKDYWVTLEGQEPQPEVYHAMLLPLVEGEGQ